MKEIPSLSIVIPAYNEGERLGPTLERVLTFICGNPWDAEVIVVNDGSSDRTADIVRQYAEKSGGIIRLIENPGNRGKGYSVRNGVLNANGDIIVFSDADLSAPIEEATKLIDAIENGADVAIGSRWARSELQTQRQSLARQVLGRLFNGLLRLFLQLNFKDTQCGFKAFRRQAATTVFPLQKIERWGFDPEILFLARKWGFRVFEVPVRWGHDSRTRISPLSDGSKMAADVLRIRWYWTAGKYNEPRPTTVPVSTPSIESPDADDQRRVA